jgi:hypothetical protein
MGASLAEHLDRFLLGAPFSDKVQDHVGPPSGELLDGRYCVRTDHLVRPELPCQLLRHRRGVHGDQTCGAQVGEAL